MKGNYFKFVLVAVGVACMTLTSCKKASTAADDSQSAQDVATVSNTVSATSDDATAAAGQVKSFSGKTSGWWNPSVLCGATTVDTGGPGNHLITITYDGTTDCNGLIRSGNVTIANVGGTLWNTAGAQLTVNFNALKVTDVVSGNSYTINGTHTITNETGGLAWQVASGVITNTTVTHRITSSNMSVTLPGGSQRTWTVDRTRSWTGSGTLITVSVYAEGSGNVTETGENRYGEAFTNSITSTISGNSNCAWRPYTGEFSHQISSRMVTALFGTDPSGTQVGTTTYCGSYGSYGYYITYTNGTRTLHRFVSYWR